MRDRPVNDDADMIRLEWHGDALVVVATGAVESLQWELVEQVADIVLEPLQDQTPPLVVFDLSDVSYFGSVFLALLLRCHKLIKIRGGVLVLCGVNKHARDLFRITALDTLWAIYDTREQALEEIGA